MNRIKPPPPQHKRPIAQSIKSGRPEATFKGIPVSPGVAIGPVFGAHEPEAKAEYRTIEPSETPGELARLEDAIARSRKQLGKLRANLGLLPDESQAEIAPLIDFYERMLGSTRLLEGVRQRIREQFLAAEPAVTAEAESLAGLLLARLTPETSSEERSGLERRAEEIREIGRRLVRNLTFAPFRSFAGLPEGAILVSEALRPADAALLDPSRLAGVATEEGGAEGHTAVMLRALGVPAVLGAAGIAHAMQPGDIAVVDGGSGAVTLNPSPTHLAAARRGVTAFARERQRLARLCRLPAETQDGTSIDLQANLELPIELPLIAQSGAHGIGLLRTEFLFMNRESVPDEETQTEAYRTVVEAMGGDPVTIRALDWGGEKEIETLSSQGLVPSADVNPALGLRGIRLLLRRPELLETQFAAILRAGVAGPVRILLPMVTHVGEVRAAREIYDRVVRRLRRA
ncbi:MAG: phosphoenolpyruvate--protein phosphotransferase, partial [Acetobacteraceae bacterium]|nr:phosphoenolpyruvate--protein phosphotransferase [Acetobacteraceae bacterium]